MTDTAPTTPPESPGRVADGPHHAVPCQGSACPCLQEGYLVGAASITSAMVCPVPPGSVVVLRGAPLGSDDLEDMTNDLAHVSGHRQFVLVSLPAIAKLDVVRDPEAVAKLLGLTRPSLRWGATLGPATPVPGTVEQLPESDLSGWPDNPPPERAAWLLRNLRQRGDDYGDLANATGDELRDALALAAMALNAYGCPDIPAAPAWGPIYDSFRTHVYGVPPMSDARRSVPHPAVLMGDRACPCGEPTTAPVHSGRLTIPTELAHLEPLSGSMVTDLLANIDAAVTSARDYLATHPNRHVDDTAVCCPSCGLPPHDGECHD